MVRPGKEADAAKALIDQGVDILTQHTDTTAPMQVAAERGIKAFGQASDMIKAGPETQLTAIKIPGALITSSARRRFLTAPGSPNRSGTA